MRAQRFGGQFGNCKHGSDLFVLLLCARGLNLTRKQHAFNFPYVIDETQQVARAYDAQCTPDFFGFNAQDELQYRGRLDASRMTPVANARRDLFEAMKQIAETGGGPHEQIASIGCSIKWRH